MDNSLDDRIALITGAARGIGFAVATAFAARGARLALVDIDAHALQAASVNLSGFPQPDRFLALTADITRKADVLQSVQATVDRFGGLDILVNNAGICPLTDFADIDEAEWDRVLAVNLKGAFLMCQAALPHLRRAGSRGRIITIASVAGQMGGVTIGAHYAASKAGLIGLTKTLARVLAPDQVTANCLAPGPTESDLTAAWPADRQALVQAQVPLGRYALPDEIAAAACFLAGDDATFITGATLDINGGLLLR